MTGAISRFQSRPLAQQLVVLALVVDPIGAALGYLLHPQLGVEPLIGVVIGLVAASAVHALWVVRNAV